MCGGRSRVKERGKMDGLRELQLTELGILKEVLALFREYGIRYYALGGTMLGAVRHRGFIPWDDDIDIGLPREDYDRFYRLRDKLPEHLRYQVYPDDASYPYYIARVVDDSVVVRSDRTEIEEVTPAWIDVFPLDGLPDGKLARKLHEANIMLTRTLFQVSRFDDVVNTKRTNRPWREKAFIAFAKAVPLQKLVRRDRAFRAFDRTLRRAPYSRSKYNINAMGAYRLREAFDKSVFGEGAAYPFEDIEICGPADYESYLTQLYGDWRTPADKSHHSVVEVTRAGEGSQGQEEA